MTLMILTAGEVDLLKQLSTAGQHGRAIGVLSGTELQRLVRVGFVADDTAKYRITKRGEEALSDAVRFL
jgi:predicted transcriptional regulator